MPKVPPDPNAEIKKEFVREYYFPVAYHNFVKDCSLGRSGKKVYIVVWLYKPLPASLKLPKSFKGLKVKTELA